MIIDFRESRYKEIELIIKIDVYKSANESCANESSIKRIFSRKSYKYVVKGFSTLVK